MSGSTRVIRIVFWLALVLWTGAVISGGVAATAVFGILPDLGVHVDRFNQFPHDEHGRLAAGLIMEPVFTAIDVAQFALAAIVLVALVAELTLTRNRRWRVSNLLRIAALAVAAGTLLWRAAMIMPEMNRHLRAYRAAAQTGDVTQAHTHRQQFDVAHPAAERFMQITLVGLLVTVGATAAGGTPDSNERKTSRLEEPELLRRGTA